MEYGSIFDARANAAFEKEHAAFPPPGWVLYRSGRDAMKALARIAGRQRVLLPALCCSSMISPFVLNGCEVEFYRLRKDLRGDEADVRAKLRGADLLLYVPYFGIRPFSEDFLLELRARGVLLAEDRTQDIVAPRVESAFRPDATVASLRKWAYLPEGGMLQTELGASSAPPDPEFGDLCREAMEEKVRYLEDWEPKRKQRFLETFHSAENLLNAVGAPVAMSDLYRETVSRIDFRAVYGARRDNLLCLRDLLAPLQDAGLLDFLSGTAEDSALYFPILLKNRDMVQREMADRKIYCPVIWPEPPELEGVCPVSRWVTQHMLALPVDQRYGRAEMEFFAGSLAEIVSNEGELGA